MALAPGHLQLADRPPDRPAATDDDLVDAMTNIAVYLSTVVVLSKIATALLALLVLGVALRVAGV